MKTTFRRSLLLMAVCMLLACAKSAPEWSANALPPPDVTDLVEKSHSPSGLATVRVIVQFNQPVAFNNPEFVKTLQDLAQARVRYLAAVSGDTHVYSLQLPADQSAASALQRLATLHSVTRVELDRSAKAQ